MNTEQTALFIELTRLQQHVSLAKLHGANIREAYRAGGGGAKTDNAMDNATCIMLKNAKVKAFTTSMSVKAVEDALCTTADIVRGLMRESMLIPDADDNSPDTTPASRVSAMKVLTEYAGGFDANVTKQNLDHKSSDGSMSQKHYTPDQYAAAQMAVKNKLNELD